MTEPVAVEGAPARDPDSSVAPPGAGAAGAMPTAKEAGVDGVVVGGSPEGVTAQEEPHVSWQDIKSVQNLIERCLQKFMTQTEIIAALQVNSSAKQWRRLADIYRRLAEAWSFCFRYHRYQFRYEYEYVLLICSSTRDRIFFYHSAVNIKTGLLCILILK